MPRRSSVRSQALRLGLDYRPALQNREGIGRYVRELVRALAALPETSPGTAPGTACLALYGSTLAPVRVPIAPPPGAALRRWRLPTRAQHWLLHRRGADGFLGGIDVFHHTQYHRLPVARAAEVATLYDCIYAEEAHFVDAAAAAAMEKRARSLTDHARRILVPSEYVRGRVAQTFGFPPERIDVTPLGCDHLPPVSAPGARSAGEAPFVLTVTRVEPRKNHLRMLRAFEGLVAAGLPQRWIIAGPPGHRAAELAEAIARSPARDRIEWPGEVEEARLARLFAEADVFLFTSQSEGFGLPPLEAMRAGVPVIASRTTSVGEVCGAGALLVDPLDVDATRDALCLLAADPELRAQWSARGRARAAEFTWRRCAELTLASYHAAAEAR